MANHKRSNNSTEMISLRDAMDRLFAESFIAPRAARNFFSRGSTLANLYESPDSYNIQMPLPGAKPEAVTITAEGDTVTLKWETKMQLPKDAKQVWSGMQYGTFQESFTLPTAINADTAEATISDGMLSLHLPKAEGTKATSIQVKSEQPQKNIAVEQAS